jgi:hypothetical protein
MVKVGIGPPGNSVADVRASAEAAAPYAFASFSVYGDLYDLPLNYHPPCSKQTHECCARMRHSVQMFD